MLAVYPTANRQLSITSSPLRYLSVKNATSNPSFVMSRFRAHVGREVHGILGSITRQRICFHGVANRLVTQAIPDMDICHCQLFRPEVQYQAIASDCDEAGCKAQERCPSVSRNHAVRRLRTIAESSSNHRGSLVLSTQSRSKVRPANNGVGRHSAMRCLVRE